MNDSKLVEFQRNIIVDSEISPGVKFRFSRLFLKEFYLFDDSVPETYDEKIAVIISNMRGFVEFCKSRKSTIGAKNTVFLASVLLSSCCCIICENQVDFYTKCDTTLCSCSLFEAFKPKDIGGIAYELGFIQGMEMRLQFP